MTDNPMNNRSWLWRNVILSIGRLLPPETGHQVFMRCLVLKARYNRLIDRMTEKEIHRYESKTGRQSKWRLHD